MIEVIKEVAFSRLFGLPLIAWGGLITLICLFLTAYIGNRVHRGKANFKTHKLLAIITIILALGHGIIGILAVI